MDDERKYKSALERARKELQEFKNKDCEDTTRRTAINIIYNLFPELRESKDEKIKKCIIDTLKNYHHLISTGGVTKEEMLAWLEKQGEQKPNDEVKPKFKVSDWIVFNGLVLHINEIVNGYYRTVSIDGIPCSYDWAIDNIARLWTIQDAKDGDVLATEDGRPFIIRCMVESENDIPSAYCGINARPTKAFIITGYRKNSSKWTNDNVHPATKEQRDLLFQQMKQAGYEWDGEKKELKKVERKKLDAEDVIEWLGNNPATFGARWCKIDNIIEQFKKDFGL